MRPEMAPRLLADRFTDRLEETGGEALVDRDRPLPWLIRRGLVQRQACSDRRCEDGIGLDTAGECENCGNVIHLPRARRARIAGEVDRELPGLSGGERCQVIEERLREQADTEQARREVARAAGLERAERERAARPGTASVTPGRCRGKAARHSGRSPQREPPSAA